MPSHHTTEGAPSAAVLVSNLGGVTGLLLGTDGGQLAGKLKVDSIFPVRGLKRCINYQQRFGEQESDCVFPCQCPHMTAAVKQVYRSPAAAPVTTHHLQDVHHTNCWQQL